MILSFLSAGSVLFDDGEEWKDNRRAKRRQAREKDKRKRERRDFEDLKHPRRWEDFDEDDEKY